MNTEDLLKLRAAGLSYFKDRDVELRFDGAMARESKNFGLNTSSLSPPLSEAPKHTWEAKEESKEIIHKVEEMTSLLKLDDKDLVDRLFPEGDAEEPSTDA